MPTISFFYGIRIEMFWNEHPPPHFHALYGEREMQVNIESLAIRFSDFSASRERLVLQWAHEHQAELMEAWEQCRLQRKPNSIAPLP